MLNLDLFQNQAGDYSVITKAITADDAVVFASIYDAINNHAIASGTTLTDYINQGVCMAIEDYPIAAISTLKTVGVIISPDNLHIGLTALGYGFYQFIQV